MNFKQELYHGHTSVPLQKTPVREMHPETQGTTQPGKLAARRAYRYASPTQIWMEKAIRQNNAVTGLPSEIRTGRPSASVTVVSGDSPKAW